MLSRLFKNPLELMEELHEYGVIAVKFTGPEWLPWISECEVGHETFFTYCGFVPIGTDFDTANSAMI